MCYSLIKILILLEMTQFLGEVGSAVQGKGAEGEVSVRFGSVTHSRPYEGVMPFEITCAVTEL